MTPTERGKLGAQKRWDKYNETKRNQMILRMRKEGMSFRTIAGIVGISGERVRQIVKSLS